MIEPNAKSLDIYQKFEKSEMALHKLQIENAKKNSEIIKLKEELQQYKTNIANTSTSFPWPEEFKCQWETLIKTMIMDTFENISLNPILLMRTINIIIKTIYEISKVKIKEKIIELLKCLNIKNKSDDIIKKFFSKYQKILFQNYFKSLFIINDELISKIISQLKNEFFSKKYKKIFTEEDINNIIIDFSSKNINPFIKELLYLCLYMNINIPTLTMKTSIDVHYRYFNKNEYTNIEGFINDGDVCLIIINPPMVKPNIPFRGIKPVICIVENPSKEIISLCEKQKMTKLKIEQSKSFNGQKNNRLILHKTNSNINNIDKTKKEENIHTYKENKFIKKRSAQVGSGCTSNNTSTNDGNTNRDKACIDHNLNLEIKLCNELLNKRKIMNNIKLNGNKYNSMKMVDVQINEQQNKRNNNLLLHNNNEHKSKSSNKKIENNINLQNRNNEEKEYSNTFYHNQKHIQKINNIKSKNLNTNNEIIKKNYYHYNNNNNNNDYNIVDNILYKGPQRKISSFSNLNDTKKDNNHNYNYINSIELYAGSNINNNMNYINNNNDNKLKIKPTFLNKDIKNLNNNNRNFNLDINYKNNPNINNYKSNIKNDNNPLMNSLNNYSNYLQLQNEQNNSNNINIEKSRNNIKIENKDEFKYNLLIHNNNNKNRKDRYTVYNKSNNNINNKIIITTTDYSKQNLSNLNHSNINTNSNESYLISAKKNSNNQNSNKSLNTNMYNEEYSSLTPMQITDICNNKILNTKISSNIHQLTDNSVNNANTIHDRNFARTTIKKISNNNYQLRRMVENNNFINNKKISNNLNAYNRANLGKNQNISPYDKNYEQKPYANLKYNLSFKKNFEINSENNNKLLYNDDNDCYYEHSNKNQHRTNSNDIHVKRRKYITNINGCHFRKEKEGIQNHSNVDINIFNRDFSTSSILSSNSQIKQNKNNNYNKKRDYSNNRNINNNNYNDVVQLKTEISERAKSSYFKKGLNSKNNYLVNNITNINNIKHPKKQTDYNNNSSNRDNIRYTKNNKFTKNIMSKKLNFQLNYESNQQKQNNIFKQKNNK